MAKKQRFSVVLEKDSKTEATGITIPFNVEEVFGTRARVAVRGTINGYAFRSSISPMGGCHRMAVNQSMREGAKIKGGDTVTVVMERDDEPRTVEMPKDFAAALKKDKQAQVAWDKLSYTHRKEHVLAIEESKKPETRARRIEKTISQLSEAKPK